MGVPAHLLPHTVTRVRPSTSTDGHGNTVYNYSSPASSTSITAWLQQEKPSEPISDGRQPLIREWLMITNESDINGHDRITFGTLTFEVDGPAGPSYTPAGLHHLEVNLRLVEG